MINKRLLEVTHFIQMQKQLQENRENRKEMNLQAVCILPFLQMKAHIYRAKLNGKEQLPTW